MKFIIKKYFNINYNSNSVFDHFNITRLKNDGIKNIIFDLDNTLCTNTKRVASPQEVEFLTNIAKHFEIIICSNNTQARVEEYINSLPIKVAGYPWCKKPLVGKVKKIMKSHDFNPKHTLFVGDQLITDIIVSNRLNANILFVNPLHKKELKLTKFNRNFENYIIKKIDKYQMVNWGEKW